MELNMKKTVAFIPLRGGSKSIPLKNIRDFCGKPLAYWVIKAADECNSIDAVYVATDSMQIKDVLGKALWKKVNIIDRGVETATDTASTESAMIEFAERYDFDYIVLIQATSPLLTSKDLEEGIQKYNLKSYDSLLSVVRQKRFIWKEEFGKLVSWNYRPENRPRRQDLDGYFVENGAFYITSREQLRKTGSRISGEIGFFEMPEETYFEIDEPSDWVIAEKLKCMQKENNDG